MEQKSKLLKQRKLLVITRFAVLFLIKRDFIDYYFFIAQQVWIFGVFLRSKTKLF